MIAVNLDRVSVTFLDEPVLRDLSWEIHDDRIVGLVGPNGSGKSTLLRLAAGEFDTDAGFISRQAGLTVGYLAQEPVLTPGNTIWQEALSASSLLAELEKRLAFVESELANPSVYGNGRFLARTLAFQERLLEEYAALGGPGYEGRVRATLHEVGFSDGDLALPVDVLSGGQRKLVALARLLVLRPRLLLLDEPDNHLDPAGKAILERLVSAYEGGVVVVSHDRYLLDLVADQIAELEDGRLTLYAGNYTEYAVQRRARLARQQEMYHLQQREIARLEDAARRLMTWGRIYDNPKFARRGQSMMKRIDRIERIERPVLERRRMDLTLAGWRGSDKVLEVRSLSKSFPAADGAGPAVILDGVNLLLRHGERVGLVGSNGAGKSLLLRIILGQEAPTSGDVLIGPSVKIGYYAQQHETLDHGMTLLETLSSRANLPEGPAIRHLLRFLFSYEQCRLPVATLSGGERSRLQMALLMLSGANLLLLDEPTNNLDIASAEVLEDALVDFVGAVLVISHDRYLLDRIAHRIVALEGGALASFVGGFRAYQEARYEMASKPPPARVKGEPEHGR